MTAQLKLRSQAQAQSHQNHLLAALPEEVQAGLIPHLELSHLSLGDVLYEPGRPLTHVYFPTDSVILMRYGAQDGTSIAVQMVGNDGLLGASSLMETQTTHCQSMVLSAGYAYRISRKRLADEFRRHSQFSNLVLRYMQSLMIQAYQTAVCNRRHNVEQQLCRWFLHTLDRLSHNQLTMTQEFMSGMLGVQREAVTRAAFNLQAQGLISYKRGLITVLDRSALESISCECYDTITRDTNRLLQYGQPRCTNADIRPQFKIVHGDNVLRS
jgi:CRP-like cAMP-binding protein